MVTSGNISTGSGIGKFPLDSFHYQRPLPHFTEEKAYHNRAITVQYPGPKGVKSPPLGFKPFGKGVFLGVLGVEGWV